MNSEQVLLNLFEGVIPPKEKTAKHRIDTGVAQDASTAEAPWAVLLQEGGVVYPVRKFAGQTWALGDKLMVVQGGDSWAVMAKLEGG